MKNFILLTVIIVITFGANAQNVGIGTTNPAGKLHIKGSDDTYQLTIDANATQSNTHPLIRLRNSSGVDLMHISSDGIENTFIGLDAGRVNNYNGGGLYNTFIGASAGYSNTTGFENTASGTNALYSNTTASGNTASGYNALSFNTTGNYNTASGTGALQFNTTGNQNTASGTGALNSNTTGRDNTASGYNALNSNTTGDFNTASGVSALSSNTTGSDNIASGYNALFSNTTGVNNTASGVSALYFNTTGYSNTASGVGALFSNTTGVDNIAIGTSALEQLIGGDFNIAIGAGSGTDPGSPNVTNTISIGNNGILNAANNQAFIGNLSTVWNGGNKPWSTYSDERMKNNIKEDVKGLDFITRLRPVTYYRSIKAITAITGDKETADFPGKYDVEKIKETGFLAQEVEKAAKDAGFEFSGVGIPKNNKQLYTLSYELFVVPLVKAVQEQQQMIEQLKKLTEAQQIEINILKQKIAK